MVWQKQIGLTGIIMLWSVALVFAASTEELSGDARIMHLINRLSFGPQPGDFERVKAMGVERYIQAQLSPQTIAEAPGLVETVGEIQTLHMMPMTLLQLYDTPKPPPGQKQDPDVVKAARQKAKIILKEAREARLMRAIYSNRQLQEVMVDFWFNHFNIYSDKNQDLLWLGAYEEQAIRPYVLGRFRDLLGATAHHPAMLVYLDNAQNHVNHSKNALEGLNENYAREIMELHTMGVDGGYTQQDVIALARILTGWGPCNLNTPSTNSFGFCFRPNRHDKDDKVFLGKTIHASGESEGEEALDMLAKNPATAHHISYQLAQYFVADSPPKALVDQLARRYLQTDGNIREVLNTLFHSQTFWSIADTGNKYKTPYHYMVSAVRASGLSVANYQIIVNRLNQMGMPLYSCLTPDGYKNTKVDWLNPDALLQRLNFVSAFTTAHMDPGKKVDPNQLDNTLGDVFSDASRERINAAPEGIRAALMLASPEFMYF